VWLGTHREPDGDAIGSLLGLRWLLEGCGKAVTVSCVDPAPPELDFLPGVGDIGRRPPAGQDLVVALDAGDLGRLGDVVTEEGWRSLDTLVVDHHASNPGFGDLNVVDPSASSTAELVLRLADAMGLAVDPTAALCLLTGLVTDTIGFRTPSTRPATLAAAQRLMAAGADLARINQAVFYRRPLAALRLIGRALANLEVRQGLGLTWLARSDFEALGAPAAEARGISSFLAGAAELRAVAVLHERADGTIDVSMRSKPGVDLVAAASALGGGGHPQASGASLPAGLEAAVAAVWAALGTVALESGP
jgi:phosphoesterase RecJ-like protein